MNEGAAWSDAAWAAALVWVDPAGLGGVLVRAAAGPVRDHWLDTVASLKPADAPWRKLPAGTGEDRLLGGLDLAATLARGAPVAMRGLLAECDGGVLVAPMAERLGAAAAALIGMALDRGEVRIEREGLGERHDSRLALVALDEGIDDERVAAPLADRLAMWVDLSAVPLGEAGEAVASAAQVQDARRRFAAVQIDAPLVEALCAAALALGVAPLRPSLQAVHATRAVAALRGRDRAEADDAALATRLVLAPRATQLPPAGEPPAPDDPPPEADATPPSDADALDPENARPLEDRLVDAAQAALPPEVLLRLRAGAMRPVRSASAGRAGELAASRHRGRPIGSRRAGLGGGARLDVLATLRAAAPWQRLREAREGRVAVRADDFRIRRYKQRRATTTLFVIDASGSSALHRLAEAKGAVELLLAECYVRRDEVAVIGFRGTGAELLLAPTRSLVRAKRSLAGLPGGGGTPLAAGLDAAATLSDAVRRSGASPVLVLLTDGRANVARDGTGGRERAEADALAAARRLRGAGARLLIDTSPRGDPAARRVAEAMEATYLALPHARSEALARSVRAATGG